MTISKDDLGRMMNQIRVSVPGATDNAIKGMLYNIVDEFLKDSNSWIEWIPFTINNAQQDYLLTPTDQGMIVRLGQVFDQNCVIYPSIVTHLEPPSVKIHVVWPQNTTIAVKAVVYKSIILPTTPDDIPVAPRWLLPMYERAIEAGVIGRMQMQPSKPYSNTQLATINIKMFLNQVAEARAAAARGHLYGGQAWRFPRNFRTNSQRGGVSTPFPQPTSFGV